MQGSSPFIESKRRGIFTLLGDKLHAKLVFLDNSLGNL